MLRIMGKITNSRPFQYSPMLPSCVRENIFFVHVLTRPKFFFSLDFILYIVLVFYSDGIFANYLFIENKVCTGNIKLRICCIDGEEDTSRP